MGFDLGALDSGLDSEADEGLGGGKAQLLCFGGKPLDCQLTLFRSGLFGFGQGLDNLQSNGEQRRNRGRGDLLEDRKVEVKDGGGNSPDFRE